MLEEPQRSLTKSVVHSLSIGMRGKEGTRTVEAITRAQKRENPFHDLSPERKRTLLMGLLAKPLVEPSEN
jgi:hypothetical protein